MDFINDQEFMKVFNIEVLYARIQLYDGEISEIDFIEKYYSLYMQYITSIVNTIHPSELVKDIRTIMSISESTRSKLSQKTKLNIIRIQGCIVEALAE